MLRLDIARWLCRPTWWSVALCRSISLRGKIQFRSPEAATGGSRIAVNGKLVRKKLSLVLKVFKNLNTRKDQILSI